MIALLPLYRADIPPAGQEFFDPDFLRERLGRDGLWGGCGARFLQLRNPINPEQFAAMFRKAIWTQAQHTPGGTTEEPRPLGWRLTFTSRPRVNTLWAMADRGRALLIEQGHAQAVTQSLDQMELSLVKAQAQRWQQRGVRPEVCGCVAAAFRTGASQDETPRLATTVFLFNLSVPQHQPQHTSAFTAEELGSAHKALGSFYENAQTVALRERLGPIPAFDHRDPQLARAAESLDQLISRRAAQGQQEWPVLEASSRSEFRRLQVGRWQELGQQIGWGTEQAAAYLDHYEGKLLRARVLKSLGGGLAQGFQALRRVVTPPPHRTEALQYQEPPPAQPRSKDQGHSHSH